MHHNKHTHSLTHIHTHTHTHNVKVYMCVRVYCIPRPPPPQPLLPPSPTSHPHRRSHTDWECLHVTVLHTRRWRGVGGSTAQNTDNLSKFACANTAVLLSTLTLLPKQLRYDVLWGVAGCCRVLQGVAGCAGWCCRVLQGAAG